MLDALFHAASLLDTSGVDEAQELPCVGSLRSPVEGTAAHYLIYRPQDPLRRDLESQLSEGTNPA